MCRHAERQEMVERSYSSLKQKKGARDRVILFGMQVISFAVSLALVELHVVSSSFFIFDHVEVIRR